PYDLLAPGKNAQLYVDHSDMYLTPAWFRRYGHDLYQYGPFIAVHLRDGPRGVPRLTRSVRETFGSRSGVQPVDFINPASGTVRSVARADSLQSRGLQAFAILVAIAGTFIVGQTLIRQQASDDADAEVLRALGMTRSERRLARLVRFGLIAIVGALVAVLV